MGGVLSAHWCGGRGLWRHLAATWSARSLRAPGAAPRLARLQAETQQRPSPSLLQYSPAPAPSPSSPVQPGHALRAAPAGPAAGVCCGAGGAGSRAQARGGGGERRAAARLCRGGADGGAGARAALPAALPCCCAFCAFCACCACLLLGGARRLRVQRGTLPGTVQRSHLPLGPDFFRPLVAVAPTSWPPPVPCACARAC